MPSDPHIYPPNSAAHFFSHNKIAQVKEIFSLQRLRCLHRIFGCKEIGYITLTGALFQYTRCLAHSQVAVSHSLQQSHIEMNTGKARWQHWRKRPQRSLTACACLARKLATVQYWTRATKADT